MITFKNYLYFNKLWKKENKMADNRISMPSGFGGLMRFDQEYTSKFMLKPIHVIAFIVLILAFRIFLGIVY